MEQTKKNLKTTSMLVLLFAALTLIRVIVSLIFDGFGSTEGATDGAVLVANIIVLVVTVICLIPQVYIGLKGIKVANAPDSSKAHVIWAMILFVITVLSLISPVIGLIKKDTGSDNVGTLLSLLLEGIIYFEYVKYARDIAKGN